VGRLKVMTIRTRPEIIRLSRVMAALDRFTTMSSLHRAELRLRAQPGVLRRPRAASAGSYLGAAGHTAAETIGQVIIAVDHVLPR